VFKPLDNQLGRLVYRQQGTLGAELAVTRSDNTLQFAFSTRTKKGEDASCKGVEGWMANPVDSVYIPVKEMLSNAPGFRSLYNARELHFEEVYADIIDKAYFPPLRGPADANRKTLLNLLEKTMDGHVIIKDEEFFHLSKQGKLEFSLLAEGLRKIALLFILIQNGKLLEGSILFWDEPEANLNPKMMKTVVEILLELQRMGVQIFIATHDYVTLKEFHLQTKNKDYQVKYHSLFRDTKTEDIRIESTDSYLLLNPNSIADTFGDLYERDLALALH